MISFKQFLTEAVISAWDITGSNDHEKWIDKIKLDCGDALKSAVKDDNIIYRGFKDGLPHDINLIDFSGASRSSRDSKNAYQLMMNSSDNMRDYPSRSKSFICSTDRNTASAYSQNKDPFIMLPFNGAKIAELAVEDIFDADIRNNFVETTILSIDLQMYSALKFGIEFTQNLSQIADPSVIDDFLSKIKPAVFLISLNKYLKHNFRSELINKYKITDSTALSQFEDPFASSDEMPELIQSIEYGICLTELGRKIFDELNAHKSEMFKTISSLIFSPQSLNTRLVTAGDRLMPRVECWFSGKAYAIQESVFKQLLESGKL